MALMVSCYTPLRYFMFPTGVSWLSKWQAIKSFHIGIELQLECDLFLLHCLYELDRQMQPG